MQIFKKKQFIGILLVFLLSSCAKPIANFTYSEKNPIAPAKIQFDNQSKKAESYEWDFGDGNLSKDASPAHEYKSSGNYLVVLKATKGSKSTVVEKRIVINAPQECMVEIETNYGNMVAVLYNATPQHRDNFSKLVEEGYFNDLLFHRVMSGFMIQGGDPTSKNAPKGKALGMGGPDYTIPAEFRDSLVHIKGALAAARTPDSVNPKKRSSGSQFYIVQGRAITESTLKRMEAQSGKRYSKEQIAAYLQHGGTPQLDGEYTIFGHVIEGLDVIDKIARVKTEKGNRPTEDVKMKIKLIK